MVSIVWHSGRVPESMQVRQVYGVIFTADGRTLLKVENKAKGKVYSLAGGTPEKFDSDRIATLKRELREEVNTEICDDIYLVGYQKISGDGDRPDYAQVRMTAMIKQIGEKQPDPDNGDTYDRLLTSPQKAIRLLNWGEVGEKLITEACKIAQEKFGLQFNCLEDEYV
jgi:ADP-ribose pyrophosphatase YjhB (NUDIX family)